MADRKAELQKIVEAGLKARDELDEIKAAEQNAANASLVGTCQKYRNSYGSDCPGWWLYRRILSLNGSWCTSFRFQHCADGRIEVHLEQYGSLDSGYTPISEDEFETAYRETMATIEACHSHRGAESEPVTTTENSDGT